MYPPPPEPQSFKARFLESKQWSQRFLNDLGIIWSNKFNVYNDKDFIKFASEFRPLVLTQENKIMTAAPWTPFETN